MSNNPSLVSCNKDAVVINESLFPSPEIFSTFLDNIPHDIVEMTHSTNDCIVFAYCSANDKTGDAIIEETHLKLLNRENALLVTAYIAVIKQSAPKTIQMRITASLAFIGRLFMQCLVKESAGFMVSKFP